MLSTIIYSIGLVIITALYIQSYNRSRRHWAESMEECIDRNEKSLKWWRCRCEELELERDEFAVKLCDMELWNDAIAPDEGERVLVCSVTKKGEKRINIAYYKDGKWHGNGNLDNVTAWMPLPELPEFEDTAEGGAE